MPSGGYSPRFTSGAYIERRERSAVLEEDDKLHRFVFLRLSEGWTPEQISGWLKSGAEPRLRPLGTETIYAFIYRPSQKAKRLWLYLCRRHKRRGRRKRCKGKAMIKDRASIHDRPQVIDAHEGIGHWEGDLIFCRRTRPILALHERKSRFTLEFANLAVTVILPFPEFIGNFGDIEGMLCKWRKRATITMYLVGIKKASLSLAGMITRIST